MSPKREPILVSEMIPLVSAVPPVTLPAFWRIFPEFRKPFMPITRRRRMVPEEIGILKFLYYTVTGPVTFPFYMVHGLATQLKEQAEAESEPEAALKTELLDLKMLYETGAISEEEYKRKEKELTEKLKHLE